MKTTNFKDVVLETKIMEMNWETGKLEEVKQCFNPEIGMRIYGEYGMAFSESGVFAVHSISEDGKYFNMVEIGGDHREMRRETLHVKPISKKFGIGTYFDDEEPGFRYTAEMIEDALNAHEIQEEENKRAKEEQKRKDEETRQNLIKEYSYLTRIDEMKGDYKEVVKAKKDNLKKILAKNFPGVTFKIHQTHGDHTAYDIEWTNGAKYDDVAKIAHMFQDSHSDYTGDYWDYDPSIFNVLFGGFSFIFCHRDYSEEGLAKAHEEYSKEFNWAEGTDERDIERHFNKWLSDYDFSEVKAEEKTEEVKPVSEGIQIVDYSEKAIAIIGDTKPVKEILKAHGCKFNKFLKCGCGWVASKARKEEIMLALGL